MGISDILIMLITVTKHSFTVSGSCVYIVDVCVPFEVTFCLFTLTLQAPGRAHRLYKHNPTSVNYKNYNSFLTVKVKAA